ncbi:MAG: PIN domain-containing protein [Ignavibacteriales bacterium]|nr:PIN domain-containing protein [Ignavibacteriales bacterium]
MNSVLLDTNILLYSIDEESKYFKSVQELLTDNSINFFTTSKNISEFISVVTRLPNSSISTREALRIIEDFKNNFTILYPTEASSIIFYELLNKYSPHGLKIHDYEIISIALSNKIKSIATFNKKDFADIEEIELFLIANNKY